MVRRLFPFVLSILLPFAIQAQSVSPEFMREARNWWSARMIQCGRDFYAKQDWGPGAVIVKQFRNPKILFEPYGVTSVDKLNGIQERGYTTYSFEAVRYYSRKGLDVWRDASYFTKTGTLLWKKKGEWFVDPSESASYLVPFDCSYISGLGLVENEEISDKPALTKKLSEKKKPLKKKPSRKN